MLTAASSSEGGEMALQPLRQRSFQSLNESPPPEGGEIAARAHLHGPHCAASIKVPPPKAEKSESREFTHTGAACASMKVPAQRRGNRRSGGRLRGCRRSLNESPRPKTGKSLGIAGLPASDACLNESPRPTAEKSRLTNTTARCPTSLYEGLHLKA